MHGVFGRRDDMPEPPFVRFTRRAAGEVTMVPTEGHEVRGPLPDGGACDGARSRMVCSAIARKIWGP